MYKKVILNGYILGVGEVATNGNISKEEYDIIGELFRNKPTAEIGYAYRLKADLTWELYEVPIAEEQPNTYTAEQLAEMTNVELREICSELGISGTMTKANMIALILDKQNNT